MRKIEFVTTACSRPDIADTTYSSFYKNLQGVNFKESTLYLNVDPIPVDTDPLKVVEVAKKYFGNVIVNIPKTPNFSLALQWCFTQPKDKYFFYLQDDWVMIKKFSIDTLFDHMGSSIRDKKNRPGTVVVATMRAYKTIKDNRICLSPGLFNSWWGKTFAQKMNVKFNPERQTRKKTLENPEGGKMQSKYIGIHLPKNTTVVEDIGRKWLVNVGLRRNSSDKCKFTGWRPAKT